MPYTFKKGFVTENGASVLNEATRLLEKVKLLLPGLSTENNPKYERFPAKITAVDGSGNYSWTEQFYDSSGAYSDLVNGRSGTPSNMPALERNGTTATAFPFYAVLQSRLLVDGQPVYEFDVSAGMHTIGITTEAVDGTPSYSGTKTIRFDEADGFSLSQPSAGVARIDLVDASHINAGIVSTGTQTITGNKTFDSHTYLDTLTVNYGETGTQSFEVLGQRGTTAVPLIKSYSEADNDEVYIQAGDVQRDTNHRLFYVILANNDPMLASADFSSGISISGVRGQPNDFGLVALYDPSSHGGGASSVEVKTYNASFKFYGEDVDSLGFLNKAFQIPASSNYLVGTNVGVTGTSGGGDTVTGGIITTLGSGPSTIDGGTW